MRASSWCTSSSHRSPGFSLMMNRHRQWSSVSVIAPVGGKTFVPRLRDHLQLEPGALGELGERGAELCGRERGLHEHVQADHVALGGLDVVGVGAEHRELSGLTSRTVQFSVCFPRLAMIASV